MLDHNQRTLLELLKSSLFGTTPQVPEHVDWDAVYEEAKAQAVVALAAPALPPSEQAKWNLAVQQNTAHYMRILYEQGNLVKLFQGAGIPIVILKGTAAAMYYPVPSRRTMGDIDFLVPQECYEPARKLMSENGYLFLDNYDPRHSKYSKGGLIFELHHRFSSQGLDIEYLLSDALIHPDTGMINHSTFPVFPDFQNGLILLAHLRHHLITAIGIRQVVDWMMFVHHTLDDSTWHEQFQPLVREAGLETLAMIATRTCKLYFGLPDSITWCDQADEGACDQLVDVVFSNGNFGSKIEPPHPVELIVSRIQTQGLFRYLQRTGEVNWTASQRHPILRPFAWLYQICRYIRELIQVRMTPKALTGHVQTAVSKDQFLEQLGIQHEI